MSTVKPKRVSPYFSFCKEHREDVKSRLKEAGQPISAPALTKALSELWRSLSDLEKQKYKHSSSTGSGLALDLQNGCSSGNGSEEARAQDGVEEARAKECAEEGGVKACAEEDRAEDSAGAARDKGCAEAKDCADGEPYAEEGRPKPPEQGSNETAGLAFPLARVKRIIKLDKEIRVVAADGSNLIAQASQLFLEHLAEVAYATALRMKHKTVRLEDVKNAIKGEPRIDDFLAEALNDALLGDNEDAPESSDDADDAPAPVQQSHGKKKPKISKKPHPEPPAGTRRIADFFVSKPNPLEVSNSDAA